MSPVTEQELDQALSPLTTTATLLHEAQLHCAAAMARRLPRNTRADAVNTNALASVCRGAL